MDYSYTMPLRPYESAKVAIGISIPVGKQLDASFGGQLEATQKFMHEFLEKSMEHEVKSLASYNNQVKKKEEGNIF
jgi:hypothetical protein